MSSLHNFLTSHQADLQRSPKLISSSSSRTLITDSGRSTSGSATQSVSICLGLCGAATPPASANRNCDIGARRPRCPILECMAHSTYVGVLSWRPIDPLPQPAWTSSPRHSLGRAQSGETGMQVRLRYPYLLARQPLRWDGRGAFAPTRPKTPAGVRRDRPKTVRLLSGSVVVWCCVSSTSARRSVRFRHSVSVSKCRPGGSVWRNMSTQALVLSSSRSSPNSLSFGAAASGHCNSGTNIRPLSPTISESHTIRFLRESPEPVSIPRMHDGCEESVPWAAEFVCRAHSSNVNSLTHCHTWAM